MGALAYFGDFRVLDLIGIVSTVALEKLEVAGEDPRARDEAVFELLREQRPDALVVFPEWYPATLMKMRGKLAPIADAVNRENITSGGRRLVAYAVDWAR